MAENRFWRKMENNLHFRNIDIEKDKNLIIDIECEINYLNESYLKKRYVFNEYKKKWYSSNRPTATINSIINSLKDNRSFCELVESKEKNPIAFFHITVNDIENFDYTYAWIENIYVFPDFRRRGIAKELLEYISRKAKQNGADSLALGTSAFNEASNMLFKKSGFKIYRKNYEIEL